MFGMFNEMLLREVLCEIENMPVCRCRRAAEWEEINTERARCWDAALAALPKDSRHLLFDYEAANNAVLSIEKDYALEDVFIFGLYKGIQLAITHGNKDENRRITITGRRSSRCNGAKGAEV